MTSIKFIIRANCVRVNTDADAVTGISYFEEDSKRLYLAAINKSRTIAMSFTGIKP